MLGCPSTAMSSGRDSASGDCCQYVGMLRSDGIRIQGPMSRVLGSWFRVQACNVAYRDTPARVSG